MYFYFGYARIQPCQDFSTEHLSSGLSIARIAATKLRHAPARAMCQVRFVSQAISSQESTERNAGVSGVRSSGNLMRTPPI